MTITQATTGAVVAGTTPLAPARQAAGVAGRVEVLKVIVKPDTATITTPGGFTQLVQASGGTGAAGLDAGPGRVGLFYRVQDGSEASGSTVSVTITGANSAQACIDSYAADNGFDTAAFGGTSGAEPTSATGWDVTMAATLAFAAGDRAVGASFCTSNVSTSISARALTATGATFGTIANLRNATTNQGNDCLFDTFDVPVTAGPASAAARYTATHGAANSGITGLARLVENPPAMAAVGTTTSGGSVGLANPVLLLAADAITGLANNDPLSSWADASGQGNTVAQATADVKPTYRTNVQGGLPVVTFDGGDTLVKGSAPVGMATQAFTCVAAVRPSAIAGDNRTIIFAGDASGGRQWRLLATGEQHLVKANVAALATGNTQFAAGTFLVLAVTYAPDGTVSFYKTGNVADGGATTVANFTDATPDLRIGTQPNWEPWLGDIAEVRWWPRVLTDSERAAIFAELEAKWLATPLAAVGTTTSGGTATVTFPVAVAASGQTSSGGTATVSPVTAVAASGQTASGGTAGIVVVEAPVEVGAVRLVAPLTAPLAAVGQTTSGGTATLSGGSGVSFQQVASYNSGAATVTSAPLVIPADTPIGALLLAAVSLNQSSTQTISPPGAAWPGVPGCTGLVDSGSSPFTHLGVWSKVCEAGDPGSTVTWTWGTASVAVAALAVYPGGQLGNSNGQVEAGSTTAHATPTISALAQSWLASFFADRSGSTWTPPTGDTERLDIKTTRGSNDSSLLVADTNATVTAGSYAKTGTGSTSTSNAAAAIVEVRPSGAAPTALAATGQTTSGGTAALALAVPLAATGQTTSGGSAALALAAPLAAVGQTVSGGSATIAGQGALAATGQTTSGGTGMLVLAVALAASGTTTSGGSAALALAVPLAASGTTTSGGTATIAGQGALAAVGTSTSSGTATLALALALAAAGQTSSGGTATLVLAVPLTAVGTTTSGGTAALALAVPIAATGQTTSGGTATIAGLGAYVAFGQTTSGGAATLALALALAAAGQTTSGGSVALRLALAAIGQTTSGGTVVLVRLLAATGTTTSGGSVALRLALVVAGTTASGGTAALALAIPLTATGQTTSGGIALVGVARPLAAAGTTTSGGTATLVTIVGMVPQWRGRLTMRGSGPARVAPSGPSGVRGG